jgi:hypothetical protein
MRTPEIVLFVGPTHSIAKNRLDVIESFNVAVE